MDNIYLKFLLLCIYCCAICTSATVSVDSSLINADVKRTIDISSHLSKINTVIKVQNTGSSSVKTYLFAVESTLQDNLSYINALVSNKLNVFVYIVN